MSTQKFNVSGDDVVSFVKKVIKKGNARRIIVKNEEGNTLIEFPVTAGAMAALLLPALAAVGAVAALVTKCTIVVDKRD